MLLISTNFKQFDCPVVRVSTQKPTQINRLQTNHVTTHSAQRLTQICLVKSTDDLIVKAIFQIKWQSTSNPSSFDDCGQLFCLQKVVITKK